MGTQVKSLCFTQKAPTYLSDSIAICVFALFVICSIHKHINLLWFYFYLTKIPTLFSQAVVPEYVTTLTLTAKYLSLPGVVLGRGGGAMKQMLLPFWLCLGGTLGSGRQPFPWIHVSDLAGIIVLALEQPGDVSLPSPQVFNGVAPALNTNYEFTKELGRIMRRPTILPVPGFIVNALMGSDRAMVLTQGQKVIPKRTQESGYQYKYPDLTSALMEIVSS